LLKYEVITYTVSESTTTHRPTVV